MLEINSSIPKLTKRVDAGTRENRSLVRTTAESKENSLFNSSLVVTLGFSIPQAKLNAARASASINKTFFPYSVAATAQASAVVVLPTPPAELAIKISFIKDSQLSLMRPSIVEVDEKIPALKPTRFS